MTVPQAQSRADQPNAWLRKYIQKPPASAMNGITVTVEEVLLRMRM